MAHDLHHAILDLAGARLTLVPPLPPVWLSLVPEAAGPAGLCLALLPLTRPEWEGVAWPGGQPARLAPEALAALPAGVWPRLLPLLCPPWLSPEEERELKELERHLRARADFPGLTCAGCRDQEERGEGRPDCLTCPRPQAPASAQAALGLLPLLAATPPAPVWTWLEALPPRAAWLMAWRLALLARWREAGRCPLAGGRGSISQT